MNTATQGPVRLMENNSYFAHDTHKYMYCTDGVFSDFIFSLITETIPVDLKNYQHAFEMGAGMGRFSFALVSHFPKVSLIEPSASYTAVLKKLFDQEQVAIVTSTLEDFFEKNTIPAQSIFFNFHLLHHLTFEQRREYFTCLRKANAPALFIEPNPWNPLIVLQLMLHPDMRMQDEWQYLWLTKKRLAMEFNACGLELAEYGKLCFLPPPITKLVLKQPLFRKPLLFVDKTKHLLPFLSSYHMFYVHPRPRAV
ncbi:MAG: hypothetical protein NTV89_15875 [Proteobacteria bacterium]|nr:hypothetical protein [Pseudomonadota bacterium]